MSPLKSPYLITLADGSRIAPKGIGQERGTGRKIGAGHESGGLYYFEMQPPVSCVAVLSPKLLHDRLGHPCLSKLKLLVPSLQKLAELGCESCQLGKHVRYFVTFIDEFSRCTWVYLMKDRTELLSIFMSFFNEIKNQFGRLIKIFRSDNAKEYFSSELSSFLSSQGVLHQSTCPHTPQQNGIAERKNRHLVETVRTLMLNTNVPVHHWGDAILTSCFLINRMPSSSLENKTPYSIIYPKEPLFHVSPRVFGCTCFVHNVSPGLDKLSARAIKCVFLGYSRLQKGYKCYSPKTRKFYMSADVTFFEQTPFFYCTTHDSLSIQQVLPDCSHDSFPP
uniref:Retrovirus-related Pol polyprotein from transposon TNT 1-94 n=1 Tax=Cajanus cajan TaxID=3821 RepID=A0A151T960_CAJCA|nr:Retrovirus-related Pol polyprotein from transposon TNT 1-94 [Cajanus cajan]